MGRTDQCDGDSLVLDFDKHASGREARRVSHVNYEVRGCFKWASKFCY
jgi:hypothetical protein